MPEDKPPTLPEEKPPSMTPEKPPSLAKPIERAAYHAEQGLPELLPKHWKTVLGIAVIMFGVGFSLAWVLVVASKNATIETLQTANKTQEATIEELKFDRASLKQEYLQLRTAFAEATSPLKKRTSVLASQLIEFAQRNKEGKQNANWVNEYSNRFDGRVAKAIADLDELGLHSDILSAAQGRNSAMLNDNGPTNIQVIAQELQKLSKQLKEQPVSP